MLYYLSNFYNFMLESVFKCGFDRFFNDYHFLISLHIVIENIICLELKTH